MSNMSFFTRIRAVSVLGIHDMLIALSGRACLL